MKKPIISIFTPTYNRVDLLKVSLNSILEQSFKDFEIVLVDDCSSDLTPNYIKSLEDTRIKKYRNQENLGQKNGDKIMFERFIYEQAQGDYVLYLCDDDYWNDKDLLKILYTTIKNDSSISMAFMGVGQKYPNDLEPLPIPNASYIEYEYVNSKKNIMFAKNIYPEGFIDSKTFLELFAIDPANRNLGLGAAIWRKDLLIRAGLNKTKEIKRQMGWWYFISSGMQGNVYYFDKPGYISSIDLNTLSFSMTQKTHLNDCLSAANVGFEIKPMIISERDSRKLRNKTLKAILIIYLSNKFAAKLNFFSNNPLGDINSVFDKEITVYEFFYFLKKFKIRVNFIELMLIVASGLPRSTVSFFYKYYLRLKNNRLIKKITIWKK